MASFKKSNPLPMKIVCWNAFLHLTASIFKITMNEKFVLNRGFIFHKSHDRYGNGDSPTFSVRINP